MRLSVSIMMHPSREWLLPYLKQKLGDVPVSMDTGFGLIENCRRAWLLHDPTADYHVVIQDDALVCDDFYTKAEEVLKKANGSPVSFFYCNPVGYRKFKRFADKEGYILGKALAGGVALCLPTAHISNMIALYDTLKFPCDDHRVGHYIVKNSLQWFAPIPSLISHRTDIASVCWKKKSENPAVNFIDNDKTVE